MSSLNNGVTCHAAQHAQFERVHTHPLSLAGDWDPLQDLLLLRPPQQMLWPAEGAIGLLEVYDGDTLVLPEGVTALTYPLPLCTSFYPCSLRVLGSSGAALVVEVHPEASSLRPQSYPQPWFCLSRDVLSHLIVAEKDSPPPSSVKNYVRGGGGSDTETAWCLRGGMCALCMVPQASCSFHLCFRPVSGFPALSITAVRGAGAGTCDLRRHIGLWVCHARHCEPLLRKAHALWLGV